MAVPATLRTVDYVVLPENHFLLSELDAILDLSRDFADLHAVELKSALSIAFGLHVLDQS